MEDQKVCLKCGNIGNSIVIKKGKTTTTIALIILFFIPGLIYSMWRHFTRYQGCKVCGSSELIPLNSPMGRKLSTNKDNNQD